MELVVSYALTMSTNHTGVVLLQEAELECSLCVTRKKVLGFIDTGIRNAAGRDERFIWHLCLPCLVKMAGNIEAVEKALVDKQAE